MWLFCNQMVKGRHCQNLSFPSLPPFSFQDFNLNPNLQLDCSATASRLPQIALSIWRSRLLRDPKKTGNARDCVSIYRCRVENSMVGAFFIGRGPGPRWPGFDLDELGVPHHHRIIVLKTPEYHKLNRKPQVGSTRTHLACDTPTDI